MKGRFSGIFEHWNLRNTEYYQQAFERLEKENKTTFNFAAAFGLSAWLVFRKMYGWAALFTLAYVGGCKILFAFYKDDLSKVVIPIVLYFLSIIVFGFFGNTLYYKDIKSKIAKGYAEMEKYNSIDPIGGIFLSGIVYDLCSCFLVYFEVKSVISENIGHLLMATMGMVFVAIPWAVNYKKFHSQESVGKSESVEITEEDVNRYLKKADPEHLTLPMMGVLFIMTPVTLVTISIFLLFLIAVMINHGVETSDIKDAQQQQSNKVAEEVVETPSNSEISKAVAELPAE